MLFLTPIQQCQSTEGSESLNVLELKANLNISVPVCLCMDTGKQTDDCFVMCPRWLGAEWLACWTQAQKGLGSTCSCDTVLGKLFTPIVPLFTEKQNW